MLWLGVVKRAGVQKARRIRKPAKIAERIQALGCDPIEGMVRLAKLSEEEGDYPTAARCMGQLLDRVAPKLSSVAVTPGEDDEKISFNLQIGQPLPLSESLQLLMDAADAAGVPTEKTA